MAGSVASGLIVTVGCGLPSEQHSAYTIVIASSAAKTARSAQDGHVAGTYQFFRDNQRITRDLTGVGTRAINVDADTLNYVRLHGSSTDALYRLTISQDGEMIFDSSTVQGRRPILYHSSTDFVAAQ